MYSAFAAHTTKLPKITDTEVVVSIKRRNSCAQMKHWCKTEFGHERSIGRSGRWWIGAAWNDQLAFRFTDEVDATAFKLRWI